MRIEAHPPLAACHEPRQSVGILSDNLSDNATAWDAALPACEARRVLLISRRSAPAHLAVACRISKQVHLGLGRTIVPVDPGDVAPGAAATSQ